MTGQHIRKGADGVWTYPNHESLEKKCGLFLIETYIKRRRGTLRKYLEENRKELLEEALDSKPPSKNSSKILWWNQSFMSKEELKEMKNFLIRKL